MSKQVWPPHLLVRDEVPGTAAWPVPEGLRRAALAPASVQVAQLGCRMGECQLAMTMHLAGFKRLRA